MFCGRVAVNNITRHLLTLSKQTNTTYRCQEILKKFTIRPDFFTWTQALKKTKIWRKFLSLCTGDRPTSWLGLTLSNCTWFLNPLVTNLFDSSLPTKALGLFFFLSLTRSQSIHWKTDSIYLLYFLRLNRRWSEAKTSQRTTQPNTKLAFVRFPQSEFRLWDIGLILPGNGGCSRPMERSRKLTHEVNVLVFVPWR